MANKDKLEQLYQSYVADKKKSDQDWFENLKTSGLFDFSKVEVVKSNKVSSIKNPPGSVDALLEDIDKKDLLATIYNLLSEAGRTSVRVTSGGEKFFAKDTILAKDAFGIYNLAFRSLIDAAEEELVTEL